MKKHSFNRNLIEISFLLFGMIFAGCAAPQVFTRSRLMMENIPTNISIRYQGRKQKRALATTELAYSLAKELEKKISEWQPTSEISCLNRNAGIRPCTLSTEVIQILRFGLQLTRMTEGAFDIRFASPTPAGRTGGIRINENTHEVFLENSETRLGIGALAKGYILDRMGEFIKQSGFEAFIIDAGGDIIVGKGPWPVAIQVPGAAPEEIFSLGNLDQEALASSGTYERGPHIVDPRSGIHLDRPEAVSVKAGSLLKANALSTAFFVLGKASSCQIEKKFPGVKIYWVDSNGTLFNCP